MKNKTIPFLLVFALNLLLITCRSNDDDASNTDPGNIQIKFENGFKNLGNIHLNTTIQTSENGQKHEFSALKYIVSNIRLINEHGAEFQYHYNDPDKGAFIVDQEAADKTGVIYLNLDGIPKGNYKRIKFGLGISQQAYLMGLSGQALFWDKAKAAGMNWSWAAGYVFVKLEGKYGNSTPDINFVNHTGNMGNTTANATPDLYREITLDLPTTARVTQSIRPSIHIIADLNQFLSGEKKLSLDDKNKNAMGSSQHLKEVTDNLVNMFRVDHVHND